MHFLCYLILLCVFLLLCLLRWKLMIDDIEIGSPFVCVVAWGQYESCLAVRTLPLHAHIVIPRLYLFFLLYPILNLLKVVAFY